MYLISGIYSKRRRVEDKSRKNKREEKVGRFFLYIMIIYSNIYTIRYYDMEPVNVCV